MCELSQLLLRTYPPFLRRCQSRRSPLGRDRHLRSVGRFRCHHIRAHRALALPICVLLPRECQADCRSRPAENSNIS